MRVNSLPDVSEHQLESFSFEWSPVAEVLHSSWMRRATALFQSRQNGCDRRPRGQTDGENEARPGAELDF
jgi:hypothetical protein